MEQIPDPSKGNYSCVGPQLGAELAFNGDCNGWENVVGIEGEVRSEERGFACGGWMRMGAWVFVV
jgi:hypothetical protein